MQRRQLLRLAGLGGLGSLLLHPWALATGRSPELPRLVWVMLRGGLDSLAAVVPLGDPDYPAWRADTGPDPAACHDIGGFVLHPELVNCAGLFHSGELSVVPAVASPYRERSHFDAQKFLENGGAGTAERSGWLNRCLGHIQGSALAVGPAIPSVLQGEGAVVNWAPPLFGAAGQDLLERLSLLYQADAQLSAQLALARGQRQHAGDAGMGGGRGRPRFSRLCAAAAGLLRGSGVQCATLDFNGWDTHARQGERAGRLANLLGELDAGMGRLKSGLGEDWGRTVVLVASEFGRTVGYNGTGGTDHGTAGVLFLAGGALGKSAPMGGQVLGEWPGLATPALYQGRDLYPANNTFDWVARVLVSHLGIEPQVVNGLIVPGRTPAGA